MDNEQQLMRDDARSARAQQLIDNEMLQEAFIELERAYIERWRVSHVTDDIGREKLFIAVNVIGKVKDHLNKIIQDGSLARAELNNLAKSAERKKAA